MSVLSSHNYVALSPASLLLASLQQKLEEEKELIFVTS